MGGGWFGKGESIYEKQLLALIFMDSRQPLRCCKKITEKMQNIYNFFALNFCHVIMVYYMMGEYQEVPICYVFE